MADKAIVTYFHHSGFSVAVEYTLLIFDYWRGESDWSLPDRYQLHTADLSSFDQIIFFVSHAHPDHFDPIIYDFKNLPNVHYVISSDNTEAVIGKKMAPGDTAQIGDVHITAFDSTDLGVSFYVETAGVRIFHAGDLNLWHWREESTLRQITEAETRFYDITATIEGRPIDICMFPVDPRMGGLYYAGANHFIMTCKPTIFIPMHWQGRREVAIKYAQTCRTKYTNGLALTNPRERAEITFGKTLEIHTYLAPERGRKTGDREGAVENTSSTANPFAETDLPIRDLTT